MGTALAHGDALLIVDAGPGAHQVPLRLDRYRGRFRGAHLPVLSSRDCAFKGTDLERRLLEMRVHRLFVGGLARDESMLHTVRDALRLGYHVFLLVDALRTMDTTPGGGEEAVREMLSLGAHALRAGEILEEAHA